MSMVKKIVTQELYYFSHEDVVEALVDFVNGRVQTEPKITDPRPRITAGLSSGSGLTLCFQAVEDVDLAK